MTGSCVVCIKEDVVFERSNPLQKSVAYSCLVLVFLVAVFSASSLHAAVKIGASAPPFSLKDTFPCHREGDAHYDALFF